MLVIALPSPPAVQHTGVFDVRHIFACTPKSCERPGNLHLRPPLTMTVFSEKRRGADDNISIDIISPGQNL